MRALPTVNETLNELVLKIFSGVNYASKLALETGKSVPVVFKQLEQLIAANILEKARAGKRVIYRIKWETVSSLLASLAQQEIALVGKILPSPDTPRKLADELASLQAELTRVSPERLRKTIASVLSLAPLREAFSRLCTAIDASARMTGSAADFRDALSYFLDVFGALDETEKRAYLAMVKPEQRAELASFFKISRLHALAKELTDPRRIVAHAFRKN